MLDLGAPELRQVATLEFDGATGDLPAAGQQVDDRVRGRRLARAGLTDDRHGLARVDVEADATHRWDETVLRLERDLQVLDRQERDIGVVFGGHRSALAYRVERVSHRLAEHDERQHGEGESDRRIDQRHGVGAQTRLRGRDVVTPGDELRRQTDAQEGQRGLGRDGRGHDRPC